MAVDVLVPPLSQTMDSVILVEWLKAAGETVVKGEPLYVIETDKANLDVESPASGVLQQILAEPGSEVQVRTRIAVIASPEEAHHASNLRNRVSARNPVSGRQRPAGQAAGHRQPENADSLFRSLADSHAGAEPLPLERLNRVFASPRARHLAAAEQVPLAEVPATGPQDMIVERDVLAYLEARRAAPKVTPVARKVAQEAGLDLNAVAPAQPGARITRTDVEAALAQGQGPAAPSQPGEPLSATRRTIARRMTEIWQSAPQVTLMREVDATEMVRLRKDLLVELGQESEETRPTYTDFLISVAARCLRRHPHVNALTDGERVELKPEVNIGLAVNTGRGLVVPVLRAADQKGLLQLAADRAALVQQALDGSAPPELYAGGTFTITNMGNLGIDAFTPILNPPQVAILGVGRVRPGPAVHEGQLCVRELMTLSLTFDHRALDGAPAARFLADVAALIEKPYRVWM